MTKPENLEHQIVINRLFDAPRQLVWDAWTQPDQIAQWWGPPGCKTRVETLEFRPGGTWHYIMVFPNGMEYPAMGQFVEIVEPEKIVSEDAGAEAYKEIMDPARLPAKIWSTTLFEAVGNQTQLTLIHSYETEADKAKHEKMNVAEGWMSAFVKLATYLADGK